MKTAVIVFAHGSSIESANEAVRVVTREVASRSNFSLLDTAFLEGGKPDLPGSVERMVAAGADHIVVVPYFLTLGLHLQRDLPRIMSELESKYVGLTIEVTPPLDGHPALSGIIIERAETKLLCKNIKS